MEEYLGSGQASEYTDGVGAQTSQESWSISHDLLTAHHERGYQAPGMSLLPSIWEYLAIEVTAMDVRNGIEVFPRLYDAFPAENGCLIFRYPEMDILFGGGADCLYCLQKSARLDM